MIAQKHRWFRIPFLMLSVLGTTLGLNRMACATSSELASACPIAIVPGQSLGPIRLGMTVEEVKRLGLPLSAMESPGYFAAGPFKVASNQGRVTEVWIEDIRRAPDCLLYRGRRVAPSISRETLLKRFGNMRNMEGIKGGRFAESDSGVRVGWSFEDMDSFLQLRVLPKSSEGKGPHP